VSFAVGMETSGRCRSLLWNQSRTKPGHVHVSLTAASILWIGCVVGWLVFRRDVLRPALGSVVIPVGWMTGYAPDSHPCRSFRSRAKASFLRTPKK
jgi:hypothetical protein